jgi:hypothetical protein
VRVFHVRFDGGHLVPVTAVDAEELAKLKGQTLEIEPQPVDEQRNKLLRRVFTLASEFRKAVEDPVWGDAQEVVDAVKRRAGLVLPSNDLAGKFYTRLLPTARMNRAQVKHLHDVAVKELSAMLGRDVNDLLPPLPSGEEPAEKPAAARPAVGLGPAAGHVPPHTPLDFLRQMLAVVKRDPEVAAADKVNILKGAAPLWHEHLGPGYVGMVNAVIQELCRALEGQALHHRRYPLRRFESSPLEPHAGAAKAMTSAGRDQGKSLPAVGTTLASSRRPTPLQPKDR